MRELTPQEVKTIQLQILQEVHEFCENNGIKYWLDSGTLLGSVRHKGYIPWDDDIDLGMLRPDYEKFMNTFNQQNKRYQFKSYENDREFLYPFGKVLDTNTELVEVGNKLCVNIDVFVFDNVPDDAIEEEKLFEKRERYRRMHYLRTTALNTSESHGIRKCISLITRLLVRVFPKDFFVKRIVSLCKKYSNVSTLRVGDVSGFSAMTCDRSEVASVIDGIFEGNYYKIPKGYDAWLRAFYGDYMQLPPEEERITHHNYKAYIKAQ